MNHALFFSRLTVLPFYKTWYRYSSCLPSCYPKYGSGSSHKITEKLGLSPTRQPIRHLRDEGELDSFLKGNTVEQTLKSALALTPEQNVKLFSGRVARISTDIDDDVLTELITLMCETSYGLNLVMDIRAQCNDMIRKLPKPELIKLDKVLLKALCSTVTFDKTVITTVNHDSAMELIEMVRNSDRVHPIRNDVELGHRLAQNRSVFVLTHNLLPSRPLVVLHVAHSTGMFQCVSDIKEGKDHSSCDTLCRLTDGGGNKQGDDGVGVVGDTGGNKQGGDGVGVVGDTGGNKQGGGVVGDTGQVLSCTHFPEGIQFRNVNTFYSISSLEIALRGIPCGGWCISKAKSQLSAPHTIYTTLSPIPGFRGWLNVTLKRSQYRVLEIIGSKLSDIDTLMKSPSITPIPLHLRDTISRLAGYYILSEKQRGNVLDPVGHFHVTNGAVVWALRWGGTRSREMQDQSLGLMVNYLYDSESSARAASYASDDKTVAVGEAVKVLVDGG